MITLYGEPLWDSPYVFTAFVALREKGVDFEVREVDLDAGAHLGTDYGERSLTSRVPALDHDGFTLSESSAIVEYLDEAFPAPRFVRLLPSGVRERARARQVMAWIRSDLLPLREERPTTTMFFERATKPLSAAAQASAGKLVRVSGTLLAGAATSLCGEWCVADADLAFMLHRLLLNGHEVPASIRAYAESQWRRPSVREFVEHPRPQRRV